MKLRAIIVDDEPPARAKIRRFLQHRDDVEVVGEAEDGLRAVEMLLELRPELLFLDIQMPRGDGFEVLREVYPQHKPMVVFTTAYDDFAIRAFEVEALDYLLKPFTAERLHAAVDRAVGSLAKGNPAEARMERLLERLETRPAAAQRVLVRGEGRFFFLKASEIEWVEAQEKYVMLHTRSQHHLLRQSMAAMEARLAPASFVRIHRCYLINLDALQEVVPWSHGDCVAILKSGARLNVGRNYKETLLRAMGDPSGESGG